MTERETYDDSQVLLEEQNVCRAAIATFPYALCRKGIFQSGGVSVRVEDKSTQLERGIVKDP